MNNKNKKDNKNKGFLNSVLPANIKLNITQNQHQPRISTPLLNNDTSFLISEAYKNARTNIMFSLTHDEGCKIIVITSPNQAEGKSTTCLNLAIAFAQTKAKVLVVDADLRKPKLHKYLNLDNKPGISNILGGFATLEECIKKAPEYNLDCLLSGHIPPNPAELLISPKMKEIFEKIKEKYDYVFIDTPPVNVVTEAIILSKAANGIIMVTRQSYTSHDAIQRALSTIQFANLKVIGFMLNDCDNENFKSRYGYGYRRRFGKYGYYSRYGYKKGYGYGRYGYNSGYEYGYSSTPSSIFSKKNKENKEPGDTK